MSIVQTQAAAKPSDPRSVERIVEDIGIPPCPAVLTRLIPMTRRDDADIGVFAELISADASLSAAVLKTANSALYAGAAPLSSIRQAVTRIGMRNMVLLVTGLLMSNSLCAGGNERMEEFWRGSAAIASRSGCLAQALRLADRETAFTFALFRDSGMLAMLRKFDDYGRLLDAAPRTGRRLTDVELAIYGFNHAQVGFAFARSWLLHEYLCQAVLHHHSPDAQAGRRTDLGRDSMRLVAVATLGEWLHAREAGEPPDAHLAGGFVLALGQFGLTEACVVGAAGGHSA